MHFEKCQKPLNLIHFFYETGQVFEQKLILKPNCFFFYIYVYSDTTGLGLFRVLYKLYYMRMHFIASSLMSSFHCINIVSVLKGTARGCLKYSSVKNLNKTDERQYRDDGAFSKRGVDDVRKFAF